MGWVRLEISNDKSILIGDDTIIRLAPRGRAPDGTILWPRPAALSILTDISRRVERLDLPYDCTVPKPEVCTITQFDFVMGVLVDLRNGAYDPTEMAKLDRFIAKHQEARSKDRLIRP